MSKNALVPIRPNESNELIHSLDDILTLAKIAAASKLFPQCTTEQHAAVKILAGRELGVPPMAALRGIHVIQGKAEIGAGLLAAMIKQSGKYDYKVAQATDTIAEIGWYENGKLVGRSEFTMKDAERAGLVQPGSGWKKYPRAMLFARALTEGQRRYAPDVAIGATYAPGEIGEADYIDVEPETPPFDFGEAGRRAAEADNRLYATSSPETPQSAYGDKLAERVAAYEIEKAALPEVEAKEKAPTVDELRMQVIELENAMRAKYELGTPSFCAAYARVVGRPVGKITDLKKAELPAVFEMLESWAADLRSAKQEAK